MIHSCFGLCDISVSCIDGASVDICADDKMNFENNFKNYEKVSWNGYDIFITPLKLRYETEIQRGRIDRIKAIEEYMNPTN